MKNNEKRKINSKITCYENNFLKKIAKLQEINLFLISNWQVYINKIVYALGKNADILDACTSIASIQIWSNQSNQWSFLIKNEVFLIGWKAEKKILAPKKFDHPCFENLFQIIWFEIGSLFYIRCKFTFFHSSYYHQNFGLVSSWHLTELYAYTAR